MKLRYISDIHTEHMTKEQTVEFLLSIPPGYDEIAVLAGDIGYPMSDNYRLLLDYFNLSFQRTYLIAGNHEFYGQEIDETLEEIRGIAEEFPNVVFLENSFDFFDEYVFVGATMWSQIENADYLSNDIKYIRGYSVNNNNERHRTTLRFLDSILDGRDHQSVVVITHHLPSYELIDPKFTGSSDAVYNQHYASDVDWLIAKHQSAIAVWIYGHTHTPAIQKLEGVSCVCNPIGYKHENPHSNVNTLFTI